MENKMTIDKVLAESIKELGGIQIPVELIEPIGFPIKHVINNLNACIQAIIGARAKEEEEEESAIDLTEEPKDGRENHAE